MDEKERQEQAKAAIRKCVRAVDAEWGMSDSQKADIVWFIEEIERLQKVYQVTNDNRKELQEENERECPKCGGTGKIYYDGGHLSLGECETCHGSGKIQEKAGGVE